ncbi:Nuclear pore complex protein [Actinidia chinensis var. chinensis]|uniref:Nuclear pore complex protein NUP35 n=1 Tax=Actinidia chinensis var. chinensis TaxID=1590841 RepID=A0A2R6PV06_ACTCC|nr:Nuclear pore complex protein [Actinidia chinensis var. chinensis]
MGTTAHRRPKSGTQSLFFHDLASPVSNRRGGGGGGKFTTPGQAAAVSALWKENFATSDLPPPPVFTLEDRLEFSPESGILDYPMSPGIRSDPRTPARSFSGREFSTPKSKAEASTSSQQSPAASLNWWSSGKSGGGASEQDENGKGSPVEGVVQQGALVTVPPPRKVARPEMQRNSLLVGSLDEEEWVTVYGFSPGDTNLVLREFEKCGVILKHVPGSRNANWMHILYQSRSDAHKALSKDGMQINGVLIVGVKPVDPAQRQALTEKMNNQGFMTLPPAPLSKSSEPNPLRASPRPYYLQNRNNSVRQSAVTIASPSKSLVSKIVDLMFGV